MDIDTDNSNTDINVNLLTLIISAKSNTVILKVVKVLNKCKISDKNAVYILVALSKVSTHGI
jgi:hypothetical protein